MPNGNGQRFAGQLMGAEAERDFAIPQELIERNLPQAVKTDQSQELGPNAGKERYLAEIDDTELSNYILTNLKNSVRDREAYGWNFRQQYSIYAYEGYKKQGEDMPWKNASNYAVRMTQTLVDTAHSNVLGGIFSDPERVVRVRGVGPEDVRSSKNVSSLLNWQLINDIEDSYDVIDKTVSGAFKYGNAAIKCIQGFGAGGQKQKVRWSRVKIENLFMPIDANGAQPSQTPWIFELISLDENDVKRRLSLKGNNGQPIYDVQALKDLSPGARIQMSTAGDLIDRAKDVTSGTSIGDRFARDKRYILECYLTWFHQPKSSADALGGDIVSELVEMELVVTIAPNGGKIFRKVLNEDFNPAVGEYVRPYSVRWIPYPKDDRIYGDSLPWLIKQSQEELDHAHNQNMNAADELIKPPKFYDPSSGFDPESMLLSPNMWIPIPNPGQNVFIPSFNFNPIFERSFERYWEYTQRQTGLTELFQGRQQDQSRTLGEAEIRTNKTEIRFGVIYKRLEAGFRELIELTYFYDSKYMSKETKVNVLGTADFQSVDEMFPKGLKGKFDFGFYSSPITVKLQEKRDTVEFIGAVSTFPIIANSAPNQWSAVEQLAEAYGKRNVEAIFHKPPEANILSPQEAIQRIMSGQYDIMPDPGINATDYKLRVAMFMKSEAFQLAGEREKEAIQLLLRRVMAMDYGQKLAIVSGDAQTVLQGGTAGVGGAPAGSAGGGI